jgi:hypothetical protein
VPSPPNTFAFLPCSSSCCARVCAFGGCWNGAKTTSASFGTLVTIDEKSDWLIETDRRIVETPRLFSTDWAASASPTEYGSWASISTTFLAFSLSTMKFASVGPWTLSSGTTRKNADVASRFAPFVSDVRVADGEMCAMPAAASVWLVAATAPDVDGPSTATTFLSETYFCASADASEASSCESPASRLILRPYFDASDLTAYFAQLSCSCPRNPASPVSGVMNAILSVLLQGMPADCFAGAAVAVAASAEAVTAAARTARNPVLLCMCPPWMVSIRLDVETHVLTASS